MSRPTRTRKPTWKAVAALPGVSTMSLGSVGQNDQQQQAAKPADDALARTSAALHTGTPNLQALQSECEDLLKDDLGLLKLERVLKVASIFTYEEILAKAGTAHGNGTISSSALRSRVREAKLAVAEARGVPKKEVAAEFEANTRLSGARNRRMGKMHARMRVTMGVATSRTLGVVTDDGHEEAEGEEEDEQEGAASPGGVEDSPASGERVSRILIQVLQSRRPPSLIELHHDQSSLSTRFPTASRTQAPTSMFQVSGRTA